MTWKLQTLKAPIPSDDIDAIMGPLDSAVGSIKSVLDIIAQALDIVKIFVNASTDPFNILIKAFYDELNGFVNNLFGTGAHFLTASAFSVAGHKQHDAFSIPLLYPAQAIQAAIASFDDEGDDSRPIFSDTAEVAAIGIMATSTSVPAFIALLEALTSIFRIPAWEFALREIQRRSKTEIKSVQPDWSSLRLNSIDQMSQLQGVLLSSLELLRGYTTIPDNNISDLIEAIQSKARALTQVINDVRDVVAMLTRSAGGLYVLDLPRGVGGSRRIKNALHDAYLESCKPTSGYTLLTLIVGGGPSLATVETIRALMV